LSDEDIDPGADEEWWDETQEDTEEEE